MAVLKCALIGCSVLAVIGSAIPAAAQTRPDLSGATVAELEAELDRRRRLSDACATFRELGASPLPAQCAQAAAGASPAGERLARNDAAPPTAQQPSQARQDRPAAPRVGAATPGATDGSGEGGGRGAGRSETGGGTGDGGVARGNGSGTGNGNGNGNGNRQRFGGIEFGIGMAFSLDLGENVRVRDAQLVDGIVRVTRSDDIRARPILETHYFFTPPDVGPPFLDMRNPSGDDMRRGAPARWGFGPFIAIQPGSDNIIDAIGGGLMIGLRRPTEGTDSFNLGIGLLYDIDVQTLGDDIFENRPLPDGETEIRYRRRAQSGLMIMSSFSF